MLAAIAVLFCVVLAAAGDATIAAAGTAEEGTVKTTTLALAPGAVAVLLTWRRRPAMVGLLQLVSVMFAGLLLCGGIIAYSSGHADRLPSGIVSGATLVAWVLTGTTTAAWIAVLLVFPSGRFPDARWRRAFQMLLAALVLLCIGQYLTLPDSRRIPGPAAIASPSGPLAQSLAADVMTAAFGVLFVGGLLVGLVNLSMRFRAASGQERQQLKWLVVVLGADVVGQVALIPLTGAQAPLGVIAVLDTVLTVLAIAAIGTALVERRLWWIDAAIPRVGAVITLWVGLSALFVTVAVGAGALSASSNQVIGVPVAVALLISLAAVLARRRVEAALTQRLYGTTPRGFALLANVRQVVMRSGSLEAWGTPLVEAIREALSAPWAGLWIAREAGTTVSLRPVAVVGDNDPRPLVLPAAAVDRLSPGDGAGSITELGADAGIELAALLPSLPATIATMRGGDGALLGLVACGESSAATPDIDALRLVASELGLALRTRQLEDELHDRATEIEAQSLELHRSRQRLVIAQDEERHRIGRDLHDGFQQRLVTLAAQLRGIARSPRAPAGRLDELADEAEDAVFVLQDLARGIYPSTLTDCGLTVALRQQAGRMPLRVHIDVEPGLAERRFGSDVEMALYYVALEALTNVQKHAPQATCSVTLRADDADRSVVLEVHDDGPGFDERQSREGQGLINMADRAAAVGGELRIRSRTGGGTWVTARIPVQGEVVPLRSRSRADR
jgi:signal transduction histidine kinase